MAGVYELLMWVVEGKSDVEVWIQFTGHKLVEVNDESDKEYEFVFIKRR